jgi:O-antigen ligase
MVPITLGQEGMMEGFLGRMDVSALRLFGIWIAALLIALGNFENSARHLRSYKFHIAFLLFCFISLFWSPSIAYGARMLAKLSSPLLFMLIVASMVTSLDQLRRMEKVTIGGGLVMVLLAIWAWATKNGSSVGLSVPATTPAYFSAYLVAIGSLTIANIKSDRPKFNLLVSFVFCLAVLAAFTRITIVAMFVAYSLMFFIASRGIFRVFLPVTGIVLVPVLFLFSETFKRRMFFGEKQIHLDTALNDPSILFSHLHGSGRFATWPQVLNKFFVPSPTLGSGLGATQNFFYTNSPSGLGAVHSEYVRLLSDVGLIGLTLFLIAILVYFVRLSGIYRVNPAKISGRFALAGMGGLLTYLIFMATDNPFDYVTGFGFYVFGIVAMADKAWELERHEEEQDHLSVENQVSLSVQPSAEKKRRFPIIEGI